MHYIAMLRLPSKQLSLPVFLRMALEPVPHISVNGLRLGSSSHGWHLSMHQESVRQHPSTICRATATAESTHEGRNDPSAKIEKNNTIISPSGQAHGESPEYTSWPWPDANCHSASLNTVCAGTEANKERAMTLEKSITLVSCNGDVTTS